MIFLGDLACPEIKVDGFNKCIEAIELFNNEIVVLNLEATFADAYQDFNTETLFNSRKVLDGFRNATKVIVSLANNHMYDFPERINPTIEFLKQNNIGVFGICNDDGDTFEPYVYCDTDGTEYAFFGHCWRLYTNTNTNKVNDIRVVDHRYDIFIGRVSDYIVKHPNQKVFCFMHWNYDMEKLPFPMHIKIARQLIDNGVSGVIGSHSHRPQAAEIYKEKPIVYGLGNFYLPSGLFFNGKLSYPECSKDTYALHIKDDNYFIQWFRTDCSVVKPIEKSVAEPFDGKKISILSESLQTDDYISFFKKNRVKKLLVPVFTDYCGLSHDIKEFLAISRVKILRKIIK